jgi:hypothetical protein
VGVLQRFEQKLDRLVNGAFAKAFRSEVQPVEIAGALQRELDDKSAIISRDRTVAPNTFTVQLGERDHDRLAVYAAPLGAELAAMVREHAEAQGYVLLGPVEIDIDRADDLSTGMFRVVSSTTPGVTAQPQRRPLHEPVVPPVTPSAAPPSPPVAAPPAAPPPVPPVPPIAPAVPSIAPAVPPIAPPPAAPLVELPVEQPAAAAEPSPAPVQPAAAPAAPAAPAEPKPVVNPRLVVHGTAYPLSKQSTTVGRGADVDIRVDDPGVSRRHASFHLGEPCSVLDLASTNGTWLHGAKVSEAALSDGDEVRLGSTTLVFRTG